MSVELLTEHYLEFLGLTGGCTGLSEFTHVKMPHCWKSRVTAHILRNERVGEAPTDGAQIYLSLCDVSV